jgi:hypothetical protein
MKKFMLVVVALLVIVVAFASVKIVSPHIWGLWGTTNTTEGVALNGFDAVSYFEANGPQAGSEEFSTVHADATWLFASSENRDLFTADPERYSPHFGGFCAFAASKGFTAHPAPEAWHIEDGALYVFADENVRDDWVAEIPNGSLKRSQENWAKR